MSNLRTEETVALADQFRALGNPHRLEIFLFLARNCAPNTMTTDDRITAWMAGLGRSITDWVLVRADYRYEQRESNLDQFDTDGHAFTAQIGIRLYRPRVRR